VRERAKPVLLVGVRIYPSGVQRGLSTRTGRTPRPVLRVIGEFLYGSGLRVLKAMAIRVNDVDATPCPLLAHLACGLV
jgi:hypothetical protein